MNLQRSGKMIDSGGCKVCVWLTGMMCAVVGAGTGFAQSAGDGMQGPLVEGPSIGHGEGVIGGAKMVDRREVFAPKGNIQMAILLDVSGSMDGLIEQARTQLWKVINRLSHSFQEGTPSRVSIALYTFGDAMGGPSQIVQIAPFTDDFEKVSQQLYQLQCSGSKEYCGAVIEKAVKELAWNTEDPRSLKMIFIAGNEPFDQEDAGSPIQYKDAIEHAKRCGIIVNTIHCSGRMMSFGEGDIWKKAAEMGGGSFVSIDQSAATSEAGSPMDAEMLKMGDEIYADFIPYGSPSKQRFLKKKVEDEVANPGMEDAGVKIERLLTKIHLAANDRNSQDLVTRFAKPGATFSFGAIGGEVNMPEELRGRSEDEISRFIRQRATERARKRDALDKLAKTRERWLKARAKKGDRSLGGAIIASVSKQAKGKRISFDAPTARKTEDGGRINYRKMYPSYDQVWQAIMRRDKRTLGKLLEDDWNANQKLNTVTVLMVAIMDNQPKVVDFLLKSGMSANGCDENGLSALAYAIRKGDKSMAETLLFKGADANTMDKKGASVLMDAVRGGDKDMIKLVLGGSVRVNACGMDGETALMSAALRGDEEIFRMLVDKGAKMDAVTSYGDSVLMSAVVGGNTAIVEDVVKHAEDVNLADSQGYTPLMEAARMENMQIVQVLLAKGGDGTAQNKEGKTAVDLSGTDEIRTVIAAAPKPIRPAHTIIDERSGRGMPASRMPGAPGGYVPAGGMRPGAVPPSPSSGYAPAAGGGMRR